MNLLRLSLSIVALAFVASAVQADEPVVPEKLPTHAKIVKLEAVPGE
jgi:hypothetical protein